MSERTPLLRTQSRASNAQSDNHSNVTASLSISAFRGIAITICIFLLIFLSTCNVSVLTTIQSSLAIDLRATKSISWFTSALLISSASVTPVAGKLCQVFTERIYLLCSVCLQAIGLLISSLASNASTFLVGRIVYGTGVAALAPVALILVKDHAPEHLQGLFFGLVNCAYTAGVACGAVIGGALEPVIGWRAVFGAQSPIVILLAVAAFFTIPKSSSSGIPPDTADASVLKRLGQLDYFGTVTLVTSAVLLLYSLSAPSLLPAPLVLSAACLCLFVFIEMTWALDPIVPPSVLRSKGAMLTGLVTVGVMSARWSVLLYMPTYGLSVQTWSQEESGFLLIPTNIGFGLGGVIVGLLHVRRSKSYYVSTLVCCAAFALSMFHVATVSVHVIRLWQLFLALFINGFVMGAFLTYSLAHVMFLTASHYRTAVIAVNVMFRNLAGAIGSSLTGGIFQRSLQADLTLGFERAGLKNKQELIDQLLTQPMLVRKLHGIEFKVARSAYASSIQYLFYTGAGLVIVMMLLQAGTGWRAPRDVEVSKQTHDIEEDSTQ